ncbi:MAG: hypothetical protein RL701_4753 [Pseudomonadota bacterium]
MRAQDARRARSSSDFSLIVWSEELRCDAEARYCFPGLLGVVVRPCRAFAPIFEGASQRHPDVVFGEVNTETERALAAAFQIRAIPTLAVSRDGVLLAVQPGMLLAAALDELVAKVRGLDMNEVQRELTKQEPHVESSPARTGGV